MFTKKDLENNSFKNKSNPEKLRFVVMFFYGSILTSAILFLILFGFAQKITVYGNDASYYSFEKLEPISISQGTTSASKSGIYVEYEYSLPLISTGYDTFCYYSVHSESKLCYKNNVLYRLTLSDNSMYDTAIGNTWNSVILDQIPDSDQNALVHLILYPMYPLDTLQPPTVYFGNRYALTRQLLSNFLPGLFLCFMMMVVGILLMLFGIYNKIVRDYNDNIGMLGLFAILISLWKLTDAEALYSIFVHNPVNSQIDFVCLLFLTIPFTYYVRSMYRSSNNLVWNIPIFFSLITIILSLFLQYFDIMDLKQTLPLTHASLFIMIITVLSMTAYELVKYGTSKKLTFTLVGLVLCFLGTFIDMGQYYLEINGNGTSKISVGMLFFLIYVISQSFYTMTDVRKLMLKGEKADEYEELAIKDKLTGVYNRNAFSEITSQKSFNPKGVILVVFDLNNLKEFNDKYGHGKGDEYIRTCAKLITKHFSDAGKCFRMGGDEFTVMVTKVDYSDCLSRIQKFNEELSAMPPVGDLKMMAASGCASFNPQYDYNINDTARRADKQMYTNKFMMKGSVR